jgi:predicted nucleic acid-binding protein
VIVKWFIVEDHSDKALALRDRHVNGEIQLASPALLTFEVINALRYSSIYTTQELKKVVASLHSYGLSLYELEGDYADLAIEAADENDMTIYDSSYVALALKLETEFFTADGRLVKKLKGEYAERTRHISEMV